MPLQRGLNVNEFIKTVEMLAPVFAMRQGQPPIELRRIHPITN